jgi:hypothetical protein
VRRSSLALLAASFAAVAAPAACVDLFHSTDFAVALADAAPVDAGADAASVDPCAPSAAEALATAERSCALLAACESPMGDNAIGRCLPAAIVAYDCGVSTLRPVGGEAQAHWSCLAHATSCGDVRACLGEPGPCTGPPPFTSCSGEATRADCEPLGSAPPVERCGASGRVCTKNGGSEAYCTGSDGLGCRGGSRCEGKQLHACGAVGAIALPDGGKGTLDEGFDCSGYGASECVQNALGASCKPSRGGACPPTGDVRCEGDVAIGCPSGIEERVECKALTGSATSERTCSSTTGGRTWDVSRACGIASTEGGAGCARDTCSGEKLAACVRGVTITIDCATLGANLGRCVQVRTFDGERPTCSAL